MGRRATNGLETMPMKRLTALPCPLLLSAGVASLLATGCFAPSDASRSLDGETDGSIADGADEDAEDAGLEPDVGGTEGGGADASGDDAGDVGHDDDGGDATGGDEDPGDDGDADDSDTGGDETGGGETGGDAGDTGDTGDTGGSDGREPIEDECTELGTIDDCLECGDTCDLEGACTPAGCVAPVALGHAEPFTGNLGGPVDAFLWGFAIEVEAPSHLTGLGFYAQPPAQAVDPAGQVALYSDVGGSPSALVAAAAPAFDLVTGFHEHAFDGTLVLAPGTYWLMGTSTGPVPFAVNINVNGQGLPTFPVAMTPHQFGAPLPGVLQNVTLTNSHAPNFYARALQ
jgi:hypothetical protein